MDKNWSEKNKEIHILLGKQSTYKDGITELIGFRSEMFGQITQIVTAYPGYSFSLMPFAGAEGYHSKSLAYSIWHIFRIEDIVAHELVAGDGQVFFTGGFQERIHSPIITTGNELEGSSIADFSRQLDIKELYAYADAVRKSTDDLMLNLDYSDLTRKFTERDKQRIISTKCVSDSESAFWLVDYWCGKDVRGLIKMPFSRHWIMHIEAMRRIKNRLCRQARRGVDPVAYCGLSCSHCFLGEWCGSCRTEYNVCSFAVCSPDGKCPNAVCCREHGYDGCYECPALEICEKGFYAPANDGAEAAKAQAMFIAEYGKKMMLEVHDRLHEIHSFQKTQEILGQDKYEALKLLKSFVK